jgi:hypothetical protein
MHNCTGAAKPRNLLLPEKESLAQKKYIEASPLRHSYHPPIPTFYIGLPIYPPFRISVFTACQYNKRLEIEGFLSYIREITAFSPAVESL